MSLDDTIKKLEKKFGKGSIMPLKADYKVEKVDILSTGLLEVDSALGVGGFPRGRVVEIFGTDGSGKTTLTLSTIAETQRNGGKAVFIDVEHAFDPIYAKKIGVNLENLIFSQPDSAEQALEIVEEFIKSEEIDLIIVDSVASLTPQAELEGEIGDAHMAILARLMSQTLRRFASLLGKSKVCLIFINQVREKVNVRYGSPETTPGGRALKFYASLRLKMAKEEVLKKGTDCIGTKIKVKVEKNKVAAPYRIANFDIYYATGLCKESDVLNLALKYDIVSKSGAWLSYEKKNIGQGIEKTIDTLKENVELFKEIQDKVIKIMELKNEQ